MVRLGIARPNRVLLLQRQSLTDQKEPIDINGREDARIGRRGDARALQDNLRGEGSDVDMCVLHHIALVLLYTSPIAILHRSIAAYMYTYTQVKLHSQIKEMKGPKRQRTIDLSSTQAQNIIAYKCVIHPHMYM